MATYYDGLMEREDSSMSNANNLDAVACHASPHQILGSKDNEDDAAVPEILSDLERVQDGVLPGMIKDRYSSYSEGVGKRIRDGKVRQIHVLSRHLTSWRWTVSCGAKVSSTCPAVQIVNIQARALLLHGCILFQDDKCGAGGLCGAGEGGTEQS